ncbi:MAG TPA: hypothetical protein VG722_08780 [Tepidisphaeraceae bacterium]|nr:hypothetical protein [Tepidisphaeraceae bacterium]
MVDPIFAPVHRLVDRLVRDITSKGLAEGDRYLTAVEAGRKLGVSAATANRALRVLADRSVLIRERSRGTFIGPAAIVNRNVPTVRTVYVLSHIEDTTSSPQLFNTIIQAIRDEMGDVNVQFGLVPSEEGFAYLQELIEPMDKAGQVAGIIAISCPRQAYGYLATLGIPVVIYGSLYSNKDTIPSVDADNRSAGRLLAQYLVERDHGRMALFCNNAGFPGEHDFQQGICDVLAEKQLPATTLLIRSYPPSTSLLRSMVRHILRLDVPPTAFIIRGTEHVSDLRAILDEFCVGRIPEIVCDGYGPPIQNVRVMPQLTQLQTVRVICKMLGRMAEGSTLEQKRLVIPVELFPAVSSESKSGQRGDQ